jgi:predicted DCC family thiol-disulfide oxidoreductase YuxK
MNAVGRDIMREMGEAYHIFYDGTCVLCRKSKAWLERQDAAGRFVFVDSRDDSEMARWPGVTREEAEGRMVVVGPDGQKRGGYDGILMLMRELKGWRVVRPVLALWGVRQAGRWAYRVIARNRYRWFGRVGCEAGVCRV